MGEEETGNLLKPRAAFGGRGHRGGVFVWYGAFGVGYLR